MGWPLARSRVRRIFGAGGLLLLSGCMAGPHYQAPQPGVARFANADAFAEDALSLQAEPAPAAFWPAFGDPVLTGLVESALADNADLRILAARRAQAQALLGLARADQRPALTADAALEDVGGTPRAGDEARSGARLDVHAAWEADLFGRLRRETEARRAEAQAASADLAAARTAVAGELAHAWFELRGLEARLRTARANAESQAQTLRMLNLLFEAGAADSVDVERAEALMQTTRAAEPALEARAAAARHRVAVLAGLSPAALAGRIPDVGTLPSAFPRAALAAPAELLRRRPDVRAAERRLAVATARIGVAQAERLPRISLGALMGWTDTEGGPVRAATAGAVSTLDFGRGRARVAVADARAKEALAVWERTVLLAVEEVETALVAASRSGEEVTRLTLALEAAVRARTAAEARFRAGEADALHLLDAERTRLAAEDALVDAVTRRAQAHVALYRALAGGWPERPPPGPGGPGVAIEEADGP